MIDPTSRRQRRRHGFSLLEVLIVVSVLGVLMLVAIENLNADSAMLRQSATLARVERRAQEFLDQVEREARIARGASPRAFMTFPVSAEDGAISVDTLAGFPPRGLLVLDRSAPSPELVEFAALGASSLVGLTRGAACSPAAGHPAGTEVLWAGLATPIDNQTNPAASEFDGTAREFEGPVFFRGAGAGFAFQVPTDPTGGNEVFLDGSIQWGAKVGGAPTTDGWIAFQFDARGVVTEPEMGVDLNADGDELDQFDVGQMQRLCWDASAPGAVPQVTDVGPNTIIQERCNWGADLDGDGFSDPMFLWDPASRRLSVRLHCLVRSQDSLPRLRRFHTVTFLRNDPDA